MNKTYAGIVGSPVTPFKTDYTIDFDTFEKQVDFLIASGANVLVHPMHIGECTSLTDDERRQLARALVSAADGRVPTFVNVSYAGTELSVAMAGHSAGAGATGVVLMPPDHCSSGPEAIVEHFRAVAGAGSGKMIAYNNPQAAGVELSLAILERLFDHIPGVAGIKDASLNMETFADICALIDHKGRDIAAYTGGEHLLAAIALGGSGCVSGCSEIAPQLVRALYQACMRNDLTTSRELQRKVARLLKLVRYHYPAAVKHSMELMGRPVGLPRRPLQPLSAEEKAWVRGELSALGVLESEPHGWKG